jgi:hypothetical protein
VEAKFLGDDPAGRMRDKRRAQIEHGLNARVTSDNFTVQHWAGNVAERPDRDAWPGQRCSCLGARHACAQST